MSRCLCYSLRGPDSQLLAKDFRIVTYIYRELRMPEKVVDAGCKGMGRRERPNLTQQLLAINGRFHCLVRPGFNN